MLEVVVLFDGYSKRIDDEKMDANCTCTLIKGTKNIVVDTMTPWDRDRLIEALKKRGVKPSEVDYVVCTHSHADHVGNNNLFLNAEHIVGYSVQRGSIFYDKKIKHEDYRICEGVTITATPGHTHEDVTVLVEVRNDVDSIKYAITGDLFEKEEDITDASLWKDLGTPQLEEIQASNRLKILKYADYIIPGHGAMFKTSSNLVNSLKNQIQEIA